MSRALVVFESMVDNPVEVARAVARGLDDHVPTEVVDVGAAPARLAEQSFRVLGTGGPLADGEAARAEAGGDEPGIALAVALRGAR